MRGQFQVYKGSGALQASLIPYNQEEHKTGAIYLEAAQCRDKANRSYNWKDKVKFALGSGDIIAIYEALNSGNFTSENPIRLFHVKGGAASQAKQGKTLEIKPGSGNYAGTFMFSFNDQLSGNRVSVPLSGGEFRVLVDLIRASLPTVYGWDSYWSAGATRGSYAG